MGQVEGRWFAKSLGFSGIFYDLLKCPTHNEIAFRLFF
jgi:hypothetical protein